MNRRIKILFLADTHIGFDLPSRPKVSRRRRGHDFASNYELALMPALRGEVDLVVHGGDVLYRSKVPPSLVLQAFSPLFRIADKGVPVFVVPGNHERSHIPYPLLTLHQKIHIFDRPKTISLKVKGQTIAVSGFPYCRNSVRQRFAELVVATEFQSVNSDAHLLLMHHAVEGAKVGPHDYTFTNAPDVVRLRDLPEKFLAVLSGHIHRHQIIVETLKGDTLKTPVFYPGSIERTSFAEKTEAKGYLILELLSAGGKKTKDLRASFSVLPSRPMVDIALDLHGKTASQIDSVISKKLGGLSPDSIVRFKIERDGGSEERGEITTARLRSLAPRTMNVELATNRR